jgi:uncharacterized protein YcfL
MHLKSKVNKIKMINKVSICLKNYSGLQFRHSSSCLNRCVAIVALTMTRGSKNPLSAGGSLFPKPKPPANSTVSGQNTQTPTPYKAEDIPKNPMSPEEVVKKAQTEKMPDFYDVVKPEPAKPAAQIQPFKPEIPMEEKLQETNPHGVNVLSTVYNTVLSTITSEKKENSASTPAQGEVKSENSQSTLPSQPNTVSKTTQPLESPQLPQPMGIGYVVNPPVMMIVAAVSGTSAIHKSHCKEEKKDTGVAGQESLDTKAPSTETCPTVTTTTASSSDFFDSIPTEVFPIPPAPPLPNSPLCKPANPNSPKTVFTEQIKHLGELKDSNNESSEENVKPSSIPTSMKLSKEAFTKLFEDLVKYKLLIYDHKTGEKLVKECFATLVKRCKDTVILTLSKENIDGKSIKLGIVNVINEADTALLEGLHKHVVVFYVTIDNQKFVWGYLTSSKENNVPLSDYQALSDSKDILNAKKQYLHVLKQPMLVKDQDVTTLPEEVKNLGEKYLQDEKINLLLQNALIKKILPLLEEPISVYDGLGVTESELLQMLDNYIKKEDNLGLEWYNKYKNCHYQKDKDTFFALREKDKDTHVRAHERFYELIQEHENNKKKTY